MELITYEQAKAAYSRGEKVESRYTGCVICKCPHGWNPFVSDVGYYDDGPYYEFRLADPYAELKAAQAQGKVIQLKHPILESVWDDCIPNWSDSPDRYRVKPDELKIEAGKEYELSTDERKFRVYAIEGSQVHGALFCVDTWIMYCAQIGSIVAPWTDAPEPYDNWQHVPAWHRWMWKNEAGRWYSSFDKPTARQREDASGWDALFIPSKYEPTNFTGTWEASLQERPKE